MCFEISFQNATEDTGSRRKAQDTGQAEGSSHKEKTSLSQENPRKTAKSKAPPNTQDVWDFISQQSQINNTILQQLKGLQDKSGFISSEKNVVGLGGAEGAACSGEGVQNVRRLSQNEVFTDTDTSDVDSDAQDKARGDIREANAMIQAQFSRHKGKFKSTKRIELEIKTNRPFAFLDRHTQRHVVKDNMHPEELPFLFHLEGLLAMTSQKYADAEVKGMIDHAYQLVRDAQVHNWTAVRQWSSDVIVKTAVGEWDWDSMDKIQQSRNSQYLVQQLSQECDNLYPCYLFNKGGCKFELTHHGPDITYAHICSFCYAIDGARETHAARMCSKRRSSSNYFARSHDEPRESFADARNRFNRNNKRHAREKDNTENSKN